MSLYGQYIKEIFNRDEIEKEHGFATYEIKGKYCYIIDVYVVPEKRESGYATELVEDVEDMAKKSGCEYMITTADIKNVQDRNLKLIQKFGYKTLRIDKKGIYFIKEL